MEGNRGELVLVFDVAGRRFALPARHVSEVLRAVAIVPLPGAPEVIEGVIDVRGELLPVFDLRRRFGLEPRAISVSDHLIRVRAGDRTMALRVDSATSLEELPPEQITPVEEITSAHAAIAGIGRLPSGLLLIQDPAAFLEQSESAALSEALRGMATG